MILVDAAVSALSAAFFTTTERLI
jgi:hypothetical protein